MPIEYVKQRYENAKNYPHYKEMQELGTKVLGVWDDHDYGINDGGAEFLRKDEMREVFLDFIGEPKDSPRSLDKFSPIHQDYIIKQNGNFKTHVILLDNRYAFNQTE